MALHGYGKIMDVDYSTGSITRRDIDLQFARQYIGGMGFTCKILFDEVGPEVEPFSPYNIVVFANGPLTGTHAPCSGRAEITTKSPLTGHIGSGNTGGMWPTMLKRAGFDVIVIRNQAKKPVYLWIDNDAAELRTANHLWGKDTKATTDLLRQELSASHPSEISVLTIGPAGENRVRFACPVNDYYHAAARGGAGAIMGAKKLKAMVIRGTGKPNLARRQEFEVSAKAARERLLLTKSTNPDNVDRIATAQAVGYLTHKNYQTGVMPSWVKNITLDNAKKYVVRKEGTCYACPISCFNLAEINEGKYAGVRVNRATHPGVVIEWGSKCAINNLPAIWKCKESCQQLGMDYVTTSGVIAFALELFQRGIITTMDTDGLHLTWGNEDAVVSLIHKIASRDGFGDVLAEGSVRAAARIGRGSEKYVLTIKGMEMMNLDPRSGPKGWIFGDLTNPRGGDNVKNTHFRADLYNPNWWVDKFDMPEEVKKKIYSMPPQETSLTWEGKPFMCRWFEDLCSAVSALGLCFFPALRNLAIGPTHLARLYTACTGWDTTPEDIVKVGERVFTLLKAYTMMCGLDRQNDTWPDRFFNEPLPEGASKGAVLSRSTINQLLDEYYKLRGWDTRSGLPTKQKFSELGLQEEANRLAKIGRL